MHKQLKLVLRNEQIAIERKIELTKHIISCLNNDLDDDSYRSMYGEILDTDEEEVILEAMKPYLEDLNSYLNELVNMIGMNNGN